MNTVEALTEAQQYLMRNGWTQFEGENDYGQVCADGALHKVCSSEHEMAGWKGTINILDGDAYTAAVYVLIDVALKEGYQDHIDFNDGTETSFNDVMWLFDQAIKEAKEAA